MEYVNLGTTGSKVSRICLGAMPYGSSKVALVVGASKPRHLDDALAALNVRLTSEAIKTLDEAYVPRGVAGMAR